MFGFLKRSRAARPAPPEAPKSTPEAREVPNEEAADEQPLKSWYGSSLDLHEGLEISDCDDEVTEPMPLQEQMPPKR